MSTKLKAGTATSGAVIDADTSGVLDLVSGSSGQYTATVPQSSGTVMVSGNMPAFSAYNNNSQSFANATLVKIQANIEDFDTNSCYDNTTNYRFTPTVAGYYQATASVAFNTMTGVAFTQVYKNGSSYVGGNLVQVTANGPGVTGGGLVYLNGTTDYLEFYGFQASTGAVNSANATTLKCQAFLVRTA